MADCLKTQLKEDIQNNNVPRLGELLFDVSSVASTDALGMRTVTAWESSFIAENVTMLFAFNDVPYTKLDIAAATTTGAKFTNLTSNSRVRITNKYNIAVISAVRFKPLFSLSDLEYMTGLTHLVFSLTGIKGDISSLKGLSGLTELGLDSTYATGDVTAFLNALAKLKSNNDTLQIYVSDYCTNVPSGIGKSYATRGLVTFDGNDGYTIGTP